MRLFIAEKPSLGRAIAAALPGQQKREDGCVYVGDTVVTWCIGHLLEQAEPDAYDPAFKQWSFNTLPIVPDQWQYQTKRQTAKQLAVVRRLVKQADQLIHAGDPDREGQLLVDEVLHFLNVPKSKLDRTQRCLINDLNPSAVKRALDNLQPNRDFQPLSVSALARARADWLYGINLTRAVTLGGRNAGYQGVLSVGRVQTPVLGLVVERDRAIDAFTRRPYYEVWAQLQTKTGEHFAAQWQPSEACEAWLDDDGRNLSRPLAEHVMKTVQGQDGEITTASATTSNQNAPLLPSLSHLQMDANKVFGFSAQRVLDLAQSLYEKHQAITYPRSDCRYLPNEHHAQADQVTTAIRASLSSLNDHRLDAAWSQLNLRQKSRAWNDAKVGAHHAIIPTGKTVKRLSEDEAKIYYLVSRAYVAQFLPAWQRREQKVELRLAGGLFRAQAKQTLEAGWKVLFPSKNDDAETTLPTVHKGDSVHCDQADIREKETQPPKPFTEATLLAAMTGISRFVADTELKKVLKETDGLGTEATRASILEVLFKRGFLRRQGKAVHATEAGQALINALPESLTLPDRTARWESILSDIASGEAAYDTLMQPLIGELQNLIGTLRSWQPAGLAGLGKPPRRGRRKPARGKATQGRRRKAG
ncbi:DNA topoisomerase III [Saccharospirillum sp. MSK14-1]|uniref:DNA topoisomerase III n=1 Tax=Saccharospirillum sp. MSK14-1 TaxID=1897632 RepID=UPI000D3CD4AC|nr:DNA topoisomerase III [Saccharospirillum sp. MSK14-1]PTY36046.1 DNA topoisomerase III [Saccharospirillum sp. MSK14-1]